MAQASPTTSPPVYVGANLGPRPLSDIVEFAHGWIPLGRFAVTRHQIETVRAAVAAAGRRIEVVVYENAPDGDRFDALHEMGCDQVICRLPTTDDAEMRAQLARLARLVKSF